MSRLNRDTVIAIVLLVFIGTFFWTTFDIRQPDYGILMPSVWPRVILSALALLTVIYLGQSLRGTFVEPETETAGGGFRAWLRRYRNPLWCYVLFLAFLLTLPVLGMLIGGVLFVFCLLTALGGYTRDKLLFHATVSVLAVGLIWSIFTFALHVFLPQGMIFTVY
ncbi:MAG: tripartite tricarboxylate transporter TctB family protein [Alphaproteobacteria bacterium]